MLKEIRSSILIPAILIVIMVLVELGEVVFELNLGQFGVFPRKLSGFIGVFTYPFVHSDWKHLTNNASALLVLGTMLYYFYRPVATKTLLWVYLMSGVWLWIGGRPNFHIGASGIVYALFGFLFFSGVLRKHLKLMALSMLVVFLYGSLVWGIFPVDHQISYEGHLFGLLAGIVVAFAYRKQGPQQPKYSWDLVDEEEVPEWYPDPERIRREQAEKQLREQQMSQERARQNIRINYVYKKDERKEDRN
jgi:membrane associated rhomboid family serine protease